MGLLDTLLHTLGGERNAPPVATAPAHNDDPLAEHAAAAGFDVAQIQQLFSQLTPELRGALNSIREDEGITGVEDVVDQYSGSNPSYEAVTALFGPGGREEVASRLGARTGMDTRGIASLLPMLVPMALNMLKSRQTLPSGGMGFSSKGNPLLGFLDADKDGDVDLGDVMNLFNKFTTQSRR